MHEEAREDGEVVDEEGEGAVGEALTKVDLKTICSCSGDRGCCNGPLFSLPEENEGGRTTMVGKTLVNGDAIM